MNKLLILLIGLAGDVFGVYVNMLIWNLYMPISFGLPELNMLQAFIVTIVGASLFRGKLVQILDAEHRNMLMGIKGGIEEYNRKSAVMSVFYPIGKLAAAYVISLVVL